MKDYRRLNFSLQYIPSTQTHVHHYLIKIVQLSLALDVISSHHHMIYQLLYTNIQQNIGIVREYCVVPPYHEQQIISAPTVKESNKRLLKFIEDRYSLTCEYDEFFVILRKLIEMPEALKIVDTYQRSMCICIYVYMYVCFAELYFVSNIHVYTHIRLQLQVCMHKCMHIYKHIYKG